MMLLNNFGIHKCMTYGLGPLTKDVIESSATCRLCFLLVLIPFIAARCLC